MPKKISITFLFTVVFAILALFAAAEIGAQNGTECPESFDGINYEWWECRNLRLDFLGSNYNATTNQTTLTYKATGGISHLSLLVPCPIAEQIANGCSTPGDPNCWSTSTLGEGDTSTKYWGIGFRFLCTSKYTPGIGAPDPLQIPLILNGLFGLYPTESLLKKADCSFDCDGGHGHAIFDCSDSGWGPTIGPSTVRIRAYEPVANQTSIQAGPLLLNVEYVNGLSTNVTCTNCSNPNGTTVDIGDLFIYAVGDDDDTGFLWFPRNTPLGVAGSKCYYYYDDTGKLKRFCYP